MNNIIGVVRVSQDVTERAKHDRIVAGMTSELRQRIETANAPIFTESVSNGNKAKESKVN